MPHESALAVDASAAVADAVADAADVADGGEQANEVRTDSSAYLVLLSKPTVHLRHAAGATAVGASADQTLSSASAQRRRRSMFDEPQRRSAPGDG
jgi:phage/plasmid primase-like uncharacterized protein